MRRVSVSSSLMFFSHDIRALRQNSRTPLMMGVNKEIMTLMTFGHHMQDDAGRNPKEDQYKVR